MSLRWPWTSRARLDDLQEQIAFLRSELARRDEQYRALVEQRTRIERYQAGLTEVPREPRVPLRPMPDPLKQHIAGHQTEAIRRELNSQAYKAHARGQPWEEIMAKMMPPEPIEEEPADA